VAETIHDLAGLGEERAAKGDEGSGRIPTFNAAAGTGGDHMAGRER
jgi:hypothetical protein